MWALLGVLLCFHFQLTFGIPEPIVWVHTNGLRLLTHEASEIIDKYGTHTTQHVVFAPVNKHAQLRNPIQTDRPDLALFRTFLFILWNTYGSSTYTVVFNRQLGSFNRSDLRNNHVIHANVEVSLLYIDRKHFDGKICDVAIDIAFDFELFDCITVLIGGF